jgi:cytochrome c-type biogenesis protein CcmE
MTPKRQKRLYIILAIVFGTSLAVGLTMYALNQNINLFSFFSRCSTSMRARCIKITAKKQ